MNACWMGHLLRVLEVLKHRICISSLIYQLSLSSVEKNEEEEGTNVVRIICDIHNADGTPLKAAPDAI